MDYELFKTKTLEKHPKINEEHIREIFNSMRIGVWTCFIKTHKMTWEFGKKYTSISNEEYLQQTMLNRTLSKLKKVDDNLSDIDKDFV